MADSRQQIYSFIDASITDPLNRQNTAEVVRAVLKYIVQHSANLADDGGLFNTPEGVEWLTKPTLQVSGNTLTVSEAEAKWSGVTVLYPETSFTLATPATGLERMDTVYANQNGTYGVDAGPEGDSAIAEQPPVGTLLAGFVLVGAAGGEVQPQAVPIDYAPLALTDAVTVTYNSYQNGKVRPNAELPLAATPLLQTLSIANTQPGYHYQIRIKNCTGQQVTISPVSGVAYKGIAGEVLTTVTLPSEGDCILTYYHASSSERVIEVLAAGNGGNFLPLSNPGGNEVSFGTNGYLQFLSDMWELYQSGNGGTIRSNAFLDTTVDGVPAATNGDTVYRSFSSNGYVYSSFAQVVASENGPFFRIGLQQDGNSEPTINKIFDFKLDGKLYVNGVEFAGGGGSAVTVDSALSDTSTNPVQNKVVNSPIITALQGDQKPLFKNRLFVFCGDSTTETAQGAGGMFERFTQYYAASGMPLDGMRGVVNYGMSGYTLKEFVETPANTSFTGATATNPDWNFAGVKTWGVYGGIPLADAVKLSAEIYVLCYGINDLILNERGNLPKADIETYLRGYLIQAIDKLRAALPKARIILRIPAPMTARPYNQTGFPSQEVYPTFGQDLATDVALVDKWNFALYNAYYDVAQRYRFVELFDSWELVYGKYDTSSFSADKNPYMKDLVHPNAAGFAALADGMVQYLTGKSDAVSSARVRLADAIAPFFSNKPEEYYPKYPLDANRFNRLFEADGTVTASYLELNVPLTTFNAMALGKSELYYRISNKIASRIPIVPANVTDPDGQGKKTRISGLSLATHKQGSGLVGLYENRLIAANPDRSMGAMSIPVAGGTGTGTFQLVANTQFTPTARYFITLQVTSDDYNHSRMGSFLVTFDNYTNDFTDVQALGTQITKGAAAPSVLSATVSASGLVSVTINASNAT